MKNTFKIMALSISLSTSFAAIQAETTGVTSEKPVVTSETTDITPEITDFRNSKINASFVAPEKTGIFASLTAFPGKAWTFTKTQSGAFATLVSGCYTKSPKLFIAGTTVALAAVGYVIYKKYSNDEQKSEQCK
ncbi:MAG: hypothetical protein WA432_04935 [Candidatus Babeliaceae bacterium]